MKKMEKGQHESAVELARGLIDRGTGMEDMKAITKLDEEQITKIKNKQIDQS